MTLEIRFPSPFRISGEFRVRIIYVFLFYRKSTRGYVCTITSIKVNSKIHQ